MAMPYLFFDGRCEEALEYYRRTLGAEVQMMMRFKDSPEPAMNPPDAGDKVMHASLRIGESTVMASDGRCQGRPSMRHGLGSSVAPAGHGPHFTGLLGPKRASVGVAQAAARCVTEVSGPI
mgnify:CR=1 FL=1